MPRSLDLDDLLALVPDVTPRLAEATANADRLRAELAAARARRDAADDALRAAVEAGRRGRSTSRVLVLADGGASAPAQSVSDLRRDATAAADDVADLEAAIELQEAEIRKLRVAAAEAVARAREVRDYVAKHGAALVAGLRATDAALEALGALEGAFEREGWPAERVVAARYLPERPGVARPDGDGTSTIARIERMLADFAARGRA